MLSGRMRMPQCGLRRQSIFIFFLSAIAITLLSFQSASAATQNISYACAANSFQNPTAPGDILIITLTQRCKTGGTLGTNATLGLLLILEELVFLLYMNYLSRWV